jgi:hypothetical protein
MTRELTERTLYRTLAGEWEAIEVVRRYEDESGEFVAIGASAHHMIIDRSNTGDFHDQQS